MLGSARNLAVCVGIGVLLTAVSFGAAELADYLGGMTIARVLFWPNTLLQGFAPCVPIAVGAKTLCEGTPLNVIAIIASFPLAVVVYAVLASIVRRGSKRNAV